MLDTLDPNSAYVLLKLPQSPLDLQSSSPTINDNRIKVTNTNEFPYRATGLIVETFPGDVISYRTGILIGSNIVLTAGHNLYDSRKLGPGKKVLGSPLSIEFYPGLNENKYYFSKVTVSKFIFPDTFKTGSHSEDYGILILNEHIGNDIGYVKLRTYESIPNLDDIQLHLSGYPTNKLEEGNVFSQYSSTGQLLGIDLKQNILIHDTKASYGQSGSGVWFFDQETNEYNTFAVHFARNPQNDEEFYSVLINQERYNMIQNWINNP